MTAQSRPTPQSWAPQTCSGPAVTDLRVDPAALREHADRIDELRDRLAPASLPVGFAPAGADAVSAVAASSISAEAAAAANGLWSVWSALGKISGGLRAAAANYSTQEQVSSAALSGSGGGGPAGSVGAPQVVPPPVAVPQVFDAPGPATPEQVSQQLRDGAGASSPSEFGQAWTNHAGAVDDVIVDLGNIRAGLAGCWSGPAAQGADADLGAANSDLTTQHGRVAAVGGAATAHSGVYSTTVTNTPTPVQFADWNHQLNSAVAADSQYPGVYTDAVLSAQQQLSDGYAQTGAAYGQYATDPSTGQLIDPATGLPIDPATGLPVGPDDRADTADGEDPLSSAAPMLTGLLGGLVGAAGAGVGAATQGIQQAVQMATQGVGQLAKGIAKGVERSPDEWAGDAGGLGDPGGGGAVSGGGGGEAGGGMLPAAATTTGSAPTAPPEPSVAASSRGVSPAAAEGRAGMGAMPMMPMGGGAAGRGGAAKASAAGQAKRLLPPERPNTARVIGVAETERVAAKREQREQRLATAKAAREQQEETP